MLAIVVIFSAVLAWVGAQVKWHRERERAMAWVFESRRATLGDAHRSAERCIPWSLRLFTEECPHSATSMMLCQQNVYTVEKMCRLFPEMKVIAVGPRGEPLD